MTLSKEKQLSVLYKRLERAEDKVERIKCEIIHLEGGYGNVTIDGNEKETDIISTEKIGDGKPHVFILVPPSGGE
jgi:hypothetical protein